MLVDEIEDDKDTTEELGTIDDLQSTGEPEVTTEEPEGQIDEDIPEKYRGKSLKEVIQMHSEVEKLAGRNGSEAGELRKIVDNFIQSQSSPTPEVSDEIDFFEDPQKAVNQSIENHPKIREAEQASQQYKQQSALSEIHRLHPDVNEVVSSTAFQKWVGDSQFRTKLLKQADEKYDVDAGNEILSLWKERSATAGKTAALEKQARKQAVKEAGTGNVRGSGESSSKIYRRADIIRLMKEEPDRYQSLSGEIMKAYQEGRVR